jgi:hypothetical protein
MSRPCTSRWSVMHAVILVGTHGEIDVRTFVGENVLETTPGCAILSILGPHKGLGCLHIPEYSAVLNPLAPHGTPFSWAVTVRTAGVVEVGWKVRIVCHDRPLARGNRSKVKGVESKTSRQSLIQLGVCVSCFESTGPTLDSNSR